MSRKKHAGKKRPGKKQSPSQGAAARVTSQIHQAEQHMQRQEWDEAAVILEEVMERQPAHRDALLMLGEAYHNLGHSGPMMDVLEKLIRLEPDEPLYWGNLAIVTLENEFPFSALHDADHFLAKWPGHDMTDEMWKVRAIAQTATEQILASASLAPGATPEDLILFEQAQMAFNRSDFKRSEELALELMQRLPQAAAPLNNLTLAYLLQGRYDEAVDVARRALERDPGNIHALSHLAQLLFRMEQREEAQSVARELRAQPPADEVHYVKVLEALATMGDDAAVVEVYEQYERSPIAKEATLPMLHNLAAVSYARQGDTQRAKTLWRRALRVAPHFELAKANLEDLQRPIEERSGAWPYDYDHWIPRSWAETIARVVGVRRSQNAFERNAQRILTKLPFLEPILPSVLERGDPIGRQIALGIAQAIGLPALHDFALGQYGTDQQRMDAAMRASELGLLPRGNRVPIYVRGQQQDLLLLGYEISGEPEPSTLPPKVQAMLEKAHQALIESRGVDAENITREALKLAPDHPNLMNFLFIALNLQHRDEEAAAVAERTVELHPDYTFGRLAKAQLCINAGRLEEAHELMDPVLQNPRFHVVEFAALALTYAELLIEEEQFDGAKSWLDILEQVDPDDPRLLILRARLMAAQMPKMPSTGKRRKAK